METMTKDMQRALNFPDHMENMLQQPARRYVKNAKALFRTPADIYEYPNKYSFILDMPGLEVNNIKVKVENGILHVAGKMKKKAAVVKAEIQQGARPIRIERRRARYMRKFTLPQDANQEDVKAIYREGVLTVNVGKKPMEEIAKPKSVSIPIG